MDRRWSQHSRLRCLGRPMQLARFYMASIQGRGRSVLTFAHDVGKMILHLRVNVGRVRTVDRIVSSVPD